MRHVHCHTSTPAPLFSFETIHAMANNMHTTKPEQHGLARWVKVLIGLSLIGFAALAIGGYALLATFRDQPFFLEQAQPSTTAEIASIARISIPASASNIHAHAAGFQDRYIYVRFDLPPADLNSFLGVTRYTPAVSESSAIPFQESIEPDETWWKPRSATRFLSGTNFVDGISQSVLIDISNPELYIVYVSTFET